MHGKIRHTAIGAIAAVVTAATTPAAKADSDFIRQNYTATNRDCGDTVGLGGSAFFTLTVGAAAGYSPKCVLFVLNEDTGRGKTIAISGYPPFILWPGQAVTVLNQNNVWQFTPQGQRWKLTDNMTFYVDQVGGNDSNDGLTPGAGAFATVFAAYGAIVNDLDFNSQTVTLQLSNATWTNIGGFQTPWVGGGFLVVDGGGGTISGTGGNNAINVVTNGGAQVGSIILQNMTITTSGGGNGILVFSGSVFIGSGMTFAAVSGSHLLVDGTTSKMIVNNDYTISGGAGVAHYQLQYGGTITNHDNGAGSGGTVTLNGAPSFTWFALSQTGSYLVFSVPLKYSGSASASTQTYVVTTNGLIVTATGNPGNANSCSPTYFPGGVPGVALTGGACF